MNNNDFAAARDFLEKKSLQLMKHENKNYAKAGFPIQNYRVYEIKGRTFYSIKTNTFQSVLNDIIIEAIKKYPEKFGTGNAMDVLEALHRVEPIFNFEDFIEFLKTEQFCCVIENINGKISDDVLRIDLFRKLDVEDGNKIFTGGVFHAFKHFSIDGINLSIGKDINEIQKPEKIIELAIKAFFLTPRQSINEKTSYSLIELNDKYNLKFVFYFEENTGVHFIRTVHKVSKKLN